MTTPPKRDVRAALATGGLLLIPLAALWLLLAPAHGPRSGGRPAPTPEAINEPGPGGPAVAGGFGGGGSPVVAGGSPGGYPGGGAGVVLGAGGFPGGAGVPEPPPIPGTPRVPPPRVAAGDAQQADFTLLDVSYIPRTGSLTPPPALAPPGAVGSTFVQAGAGAVGLWIGVRGDLGVQTLAVPGDGRRHAYPFGRFSLVVDTNISTRWEGPGGRPLSGADDQPPYEVSISGGPPTPHTPGRPGMQTWILTLTPARFSDRFRVTALPLSASGRPTGPAVALRCQRVTAAALFVQIPGGYGPATRQFRVSVARAGGEADGNKAQGGAASWLIAGLPPAVGDGTDGTAAKPAASARVGPFVLRAVAAEAEDTSGDAGFSDRHPDRPGQPYSQNMDQHPWTGLPTVRYLLLARAAAPPPPGQNWLFQLDRVTPQWGSPPQPPLPGSFPSGSGGFPGASPGAAAPPLSGSGGYPGGSYPGGSFAGGKLISSPGVPLALGLFPLPGPAFRTDQKEWVLQDGEVGGAWPGQQRRVTLQGTAIRQATRTETVTFHDAEVVWDAGFGGDRIVWHHPETVTTASGIAVTVLNGRPGRRDIPAPPPGQSGGQSFGQGWWYDRGNAELLLAWHLPPGLPSGQNASLNAPRVAEPPQGAGPLPASWDTVRPDPYPGAVSLPGTAAAARPLTQNGYSPLRLSVWAAQSPTRTPMPPVTFSPPPYPLGRPSAQGQPFMPGQPFVPGQSPAPLPRYSWREGPFVMKASPLPRRLAAITLRITIREEQERRPVVLRVPVSATFPPGTDPRARSAMPVPMRRAPLVLSSPSPTPPRGGGRNRRKELPAMALL